MPYYKIFQNVMSARACLHCSIVVFSSPHRNFRKRVPPVLGVTTQFHAWWHILTGLGSYLHILFR